MSLKACIPGMVERGEIDRARGARMAELFDRLERHYARSMGPDAAAAEASEATLRQLAGEAELKKRQTLLQEARQRTALADLDRYDGGASYAAIRGMMDRDPRAGRYRNVTVAGQVIEFEAHARIREFIQRHRRDLIGRPKDPDGLRNVVLEMHGQATGDARAKLFADALSDEFELLRQRFNAAGGNIGKLDHYFPHNWSPLAVRGASRAEFVDVVMPELDRARMLDESGTPLDDEGLAELLGDIHATIRANGLTGEPSAAFRGMGKLANQRADHRVLHFKDGEAWLRVNDRFGAERNPFNAILGHIRGMASDIAAMERFGPNPDATVRYLIDAVAKRNAASEKVDVPDAAGTSGGRKFTEDLWRYVKGEGRELAAPDSWLYGPPVWFTRASDGLRNLLTSTMLGSAPLSAISDLNTQILARRFNALPASGALTGYLRQLNPASEADRRLAEELGLGMRDASRSLLSLSRYYGEIDRTGWTTVAADAVLRLSGLNKWTEAGQRDFGLVFLRALARERNQTFDALSSEARARFERGGIDRAMWETIRKSATKASGRGELIDPQAIADITVRERLMDMILGETAAAVQDSSAAVRAAMAGQYGTWRSWLTSNTLQFKAFGIGLLLEQGRRIAALGPRRGAIYGAQFFIGMTVFGALAIQLREIAKGRDPRPMDTTEFWGDAALSGGGLGIFGDVIGSFQNDRIGGWGELVGGPVGSFFTDVGKAGAKTMPGKEREDGTRREANPAGAALDLAKRYTPGNSLWYLRAGWEQLVIDELGAQYDPSFEDRMRRQAKRDAKNRQGRWLQHGQPTRLPNLGNALGEAELIDDGLDLDDPVIGE